MSDEVTVARAGLRDRIAGAVLLGSGIAAGLEATTFNVAFLTDPVGPKALPLLVAVVFVGAGLRMLAGPRPDVDLPEGPAAKRMALAGGAFVVYAAVLPVIGFFAATSLVVFALGLLFGGSRVGSATAGMVLSASLWLLFVLVLSLPLPIGSLWIR